MRHGTGFDPFKSEPLGQIPFLWPLLVTYAGLSMTCKGVDFAVLFPGVFLPISQGLQ